MRKGKLVCNLNYGEVFLYLLGWILLTLITMGIALPFFSFWLIKYCLNHTIIELEA